MMTDQVLLRISFGVASLIFELVLFIMLKIQGYGRKDNNMKFQTLVILVLLRKYAPAFSTTSSASRSIFTLPGPSSFYCSSPCLS